MSLLNQRTVCFTGSLSQLRADCESAAKAAGATVTKSVTAKTDLLVAGPGAGSKIKAATAKGIEVWDEDAFNAALGGKKAPAKKAPAKKAAAKRKAPAAQAKAPAAAPAAKKAKTAAAASGGGNIPIDSGLTNLGALGPSPAVHSDYNWLGNQTDIGNNNNKFYRGQVLQGGTGYFSWTRWGRVGESGQSNLEGPLDEAGAVAAFEKKFKGKSGKKWEGETAEYGEANSKKYTVIHEKHDGGGGGQTAKLAAAGGGAAAAPVAYAPATIKGKLADFVGLVTNADMFADQLANMGIDVSKMPLGDISQTTVDSGMAALLELAKEYTRKSPRTAELQRLSSKFYTYIPHNFGRKAPPVITNTDINMKKDMLNIIGDVGAAVQSAKRTRSKKGSKAKAAALEPAVIDTKYESLGAKLKQLATTSAEYKAVATYTKNTQGYRKCQVADVFSVEDCANAKAFAKETKGLGNRKLLWHGTNVAVVAAILKSGLRIMPHSGGRVGSGVYLASENGKSAGYCTAQGHDGVMFLVEAALGDQHIINNDGAVGYNDRDPVSAIGKDSVLAIGETEPDPAADTVHKFDKLDVTVPQGKVIKNPALKDHGGSSSFSQSEYLIYSENKVRIRYVIRMKFGTAGGNWH